MIKKVPKKLADRNRPFFAIIILLLISFLAKGQAVFNPAQPPGMFITSNKPFSMAQAGPDGARTYKADSINLLYRPFNGVAEVLTYFPLGSKSRVGQFPIIVNVGGALQSNGQFIGGQIFEYWWRNGQLDSQLVLKSPINSGACSGCLINTNNLSDVSNASTSRTNLGLGSIATLSSTSGGDLSGTWPNITVARFNGQLPNFYQNYNNLFNTPTIPAQFNPIAGTGIGLSGSYPNITITATGGINTAGYGLIIAGGVVAVDSMNYRKMDTLYALNDSTIFYSINGRPYTVVVKGGVNGGGGGSGTVNSFSFTNANGISGTVTNPTSTPNLTLSLGNITPGTVNGLTLSALTNGFSIVGGTTPATLTVPSNATVSGTNTGDVTLSGQNYLSLVGQAITANAVDLSGSNATGTLAAGREPAHTGDATNSAGSLAMSVVGIRGSSVPTLSTGNLRYNGSSLVWDATAYLTNITGLVTAGSNVTISGSGTSASPYVINASGGGGGGFIGNGGSAYRLVNYNAQLVKSVASSYGLILDSSTTNQINFKFDSATVFAQLRATLGDTLYLQNIGATGVGLGWITNANTINLSKLIAGTNITIVRNNDSTTTINSTGGGGGGSPIVNVGTGGFRLVNYNLQGVKGLTATDGNSTWDSTGTNLINLSIVHPNTRPTTTVSSNTTMSLVAGDYVEAIWVDPTSATTGFQVGTTPTGTDIIPNINLLSSSKNNFSVGYRATGSVTLYFQNISSSTVITLIKQQ